MPLEQSGLALVTETPKLLRPTSAQSGEMQLVPSTNGVCGLP